MIIYTRDTVSFFKFIMIGFKSEQFA